MIKVKASIEVWEIDGRDTSEFPTKPKDVLVESHRDNNNLVVLHIDGYGSLTIKGSDLITAVGHATHVNKWG